MRDIVAKFVTFKKSFAVLAVCFYPACGTESVEDTFACCTCSYSGPGCDSTRCDCVSNASANVTRDECEESCRAKLECGATSPLGVEAADDCGSAPEPPPEPDRWENCDWLTGATMPTPGAQIPAANAADLSGAVLGDGQFDPTALRKPLELMVTGAPSGLVFDQAYAVRYSPSVESAYLIVRATNTGTAYQCDLQDTKTWLSSEGTTLDASSGYEGLGPRGLSQGVERTCLGPGEVGYLTDINLGDEVPFYSSVSALSLNFTESIEGAAAPPRMRPIGYEAGSCSSSPSFRIAVENVGDVSARASGADVILLDLEGLPVGWASAESRSTPDHPSDPIPPGGTAYLYGSIIFPHADRLVAYASGYVP